MPFPWKKVKSTKISQFVNDHLHNSQKRRDGSSLVVETGFPTSLVDLFMKNREKLKKPSKKRRQNQIPPITPLDDGNNPILAGSAASFPSPSPSRSPSIAGSHVHSPLRCPSPLRSPLLLPLPSEGVNEIVFGGSSDVGAVVGLDEGEQGGERVVDANTVLFVVLKMFFVVVLALGTKRLTAGITLSAFLLFLLEYAGKHVCRLSKPCSEIKGLLRSIVQGVRRVLRFKDVQDCSLEPGSSSVRRCGSSCLDQEIEVVEPRRYFSNHVDEIQPDQDESRLSGRSEYQEIKSQEVLMEQEESVCRGAESKRKSRRAKIKSKMKKLFPRKSRSSGKEHDPQKPEIAKGDSFILFNKQQIDKHQLDCASELSSVSSGGYKEEDGMSTISASVGLSEISEEACTNKEIGAGLSWKYLVIGLIVLIGLIKGRAFALLLSISWLLLLKLSEKLPGYKKASIISSCNDKFD